MTSVSGRNVALLYRAERDRAQLAPGLFRSPAVLSQINRSLGGRRHGKSHGIDVLPFGATDEERVIKLRVDGARGYTLALPFDGERPGIGRARPEDFDETGALREDAVWRMVGEATGPSVAIMGHVAFALAHRHARNEGRRPDGRFWFTPSDVADLLGYARVGNGKASKSRITRDAIKTVRENFERYANATLTMTVNLPDGTEHKVTGRLLYPTTLEHATRKPGQKGRDKRVEYRIRDQLWALMARNHIVIPEALLNREGEKADTWALCIRLYEILAVHAGRNARRVAKGERLPLSIEYLMREANLAGPTMEPRKARRQIMTHLAKLAARGAIVFEEATVAGGPGIHYELARERRSELSGVAARHHELTARAQNHTSRRPSGDRGRTKSK